MSELRGDWSKFVVPFFGVRKAFAAFTDEVVSIAKENVELRKLLRSVLEYLDPAGRQDMCNKECPAYAMCAGKTECKFLEWTNQKMNEMTATVQQDYARVTR